MMKALKIDSSKKLVVEALGIGIERGKELRLEAAKIISSTNDFRDSLSAIREICNTEEEYTWVLIIHSMMIEP